MQAIVNKQVCKWFCCGIPLESDQSTFYGNPTGACYNGWRKDTELDTINTVSLGEKLSGPRIMGSLFPEKI